MSGLDISSNPQIAYQLDNARDAAKEEMLNKTRHADKSSVRQAAEEFEAMFLSQMVSYMYTDIDPNNPFGGGKGEEVFRSLMIDEYGKLMVRSGGVGIADEVEKEMLRMQEMAQNLR